MKILMIDDDNNFCEAISLQLRQNGYDVDICNDGDDGLRWIRQRAHDLILLDRMLPTVHGLTVLQIMRKEGIHTAVLLVTALGTVGERVDGLDAGADDYLVKPFASQELFARIRAMSRRPQKWESSKEIVYGDITYHSDEHLLTGKKEQCVLSKREGDLFEMFVKNPMQTIPRAVLLSRVWGPDAEVEEGNLDNYIHFLRRRLDTIESSLKIKTVRGIGYRLES